jgi:hypothetical protein
MTKILSPFRYCEHLDDNRGCHALGGMLIHGMVFCEWHGKRIVDMLENQAEAIEFIYEEVQDVSNIKKRR